MRSRPSEAVTMPLPTELTTPPVTKMYFVITPRSVGEGPGFIFCAGRGCVNAGREPTGSQYSLELTDSRRSSGNGPKSLAPAGLQRAIRPRTTPCSGLGSWVLLEASGHEFDRGPQVGVG